MKSKELFVSSKQEIRKSSNEYLTDEIMADSANFSDREYSLIVKFAGDARQTEDQKKESQKILGSWWMSKYGFPFELKLERDELLRRKYEPAEEQKEASSLQKELLESIKSGDKHRIKEIKNKYREEFPDQLEGVEVMFSLPELLKKTKKFNNREKGYVSKPEDFRDLCESQFLATHFVLINSRDKDFLNNFWSAMQSLAEADGTIHEFNIIRRGIISQVSVDLILNELGMAPQLSHPREDAFEKTGMWIENKTRVQVKGSEYVLEPAIMDADETVFPGIKTGRNDQSEYFNSKFAHENSQFKAKIKKIDPNSRGYFLVVPMHMIDFVTGRPDEKLVEFFRNKIKEHATKDVQAKSS